jgi:hypothetical protein
MSCEDSSLSFLGINSLGFRFNLVLVFASYYIVEKGGFFAFFFLISFFSHTLVNLGIETRFRSKFLLLV